MSPWNCLSLWRGVSNCTFITMPKNCLSEVLSMYKAPVCYSKHIWRVNIIWLFCTWYNGIKVCATDIFTWRYEGFSLHVHPNIFNSNDIHCTLSYRLLSIGSLLSTEPHQATAWGFSSFSSSWIYLRNNEKQETMSHDMNILSRIES